MIIGSNDTIMTLVDLVIVQRIQARQCALASLSAMSVDKALLYECSGFDHIVGKACDPCIIIIGCVPTYHQTSGDFDFYSIFELVLRLEMSYLWKRKHGDRKIVKANASFE